MGPTAPGKARSSFPEPISIGRKVLPVASTAGSDDPGGVKRSHISAGTRVLAVFGAGFLAFGIASLLVPWQVAAMIGWSVSAAAFVASVWFSVGRMDGGATAEFAMIEDDSRAAADLVLITASAASLLGVALTLLKASGESGSARALITGIATLSVILSWGAVHTVFMLRYARLYFENGGGIDFNDDQTPNYLDFAYIAFTIGMTYQVSDTAVTVNDIRRTAFRHALLSYVFGTGVVAMLINVVAGLLNR
jgi:uncharacterized membrane protein